MLKKAAGKFMSILANLKTNLTWKCDFSSTQGWNEAVFLAMFSFQSRLRVQVESTIHFDTLLTSFKVSSVPRASFVALLEQ
jgi:hypothetical protein